MLFKPGLLALGQTLSLTILSEAKTTPAPKPARYSVPAAGVKVAFPNANTYDLTWTSSGLLGVLSLTKTGKLVISASAQKCVVAVTVPVPSVSVPGVPGSVTSPINGILSTVANGVNGVLSPVNSAVGPILGGVNGTVGGITGGLTGGNPVAGTPPSGSSPGTVYKPTGPTVAQQTVPQGYGNGSGLGGGYQSGTGSSINAPALGFTGSGKSGATTSSVKSGGSPKTIDLAASKPRSALDGWSTLVVVIAIVALSGATAFYARTFLLHPAPAPARVKA
ncbi:MAG: hypothetical protein ACR2N4_18240 [Jatrophihabitans sp.]